MLREISNQSARFTWRRQKADQRIEKGERNTLPLSYIKERQPEDIEVRKGILSIQK